MLTTRFVLSIFSVASMVLAPGAVTGQTYPNKPIRIVTSLPGGGNDFAARVMAQGLAGPLGQPVIVDNRGAAPAMSIVFKGQPDGYTLLLTGSDFWIGPLIRKTAWDPVKDFSPISHTTTAPNVLVVHPALPVKSINELIALAKSKPGALNYSSSSIGSANHLGAELFKSMAGVNIVHIPYSGGGPAITAVLGGEVQLAFIAPAGVASLVKAGKLRALAVTSPKPSELAPGLPTIAATVPGYQIGSATAVLAPARMPGAIINRLNQEIVRLLSQPDVKETFFKVGVEVVASSPQEFAATMKSEMARLGKVIKDAGLQEK